MDEKLTYNPTELAKVLGIGRNAAYALCHQDGFPAFRNGTSILIPKDELVRWLSEQCVGGVAD